MQPLPFQPDTHPDEFAKLEIVGGSLDGSIMDIPLPLPPRFLKLVRPPRGVEVYRYEERLPRAGLPRRVVYVFDAHATTNEDVA